MSEIEFPTNRWPIDCNMELSVEHFDDIRRAIYRRWKGLGKWPFCYEEYLSREMQYSDFNYFTYQYGGDGYHKHGIKGDNFSGTHYWEYTDYPRLLKLWYEAGEIPPRPDPLLKSPYDSHFEHHGTWIYLGEQIRYESVVVDPWEVMPIWTPAWTFLPMDVKYWEEMDYQMRQQRQEINWWIAWYHYINAYHSRPDPDDADGDVFCKNSGNKYNPSNYDCEYIDDSWQPAFQHYQAAIDNLATQITWADYFDAPMRGYWPDPDVLQGAYSDWKDVKDMVCISWLTKSFNGSDFQTCSPTDYYGYFLQNRLDYFLWLAEEQGSIEVDTWLLQIQKTSSEKAWVVRPYWKMHNCDLDGEMSTHVLNDFKAVLELMQYKSVTGDPAITYGQVNVSGWIAGASAAWSKLKELADTTVLDYINHENEEFSLGSDSGYDCQYMEYFRNYWHWTWSSAITPSGAYVQLFQGGESSTRANSDCSGTENGSYANGLLRFEISTLTAGAVPDPGMESYDPFVYGAIVARHWKWRSCGSPTQCDGWICGAGGLWSESSCKLIGRTTFGGLPYPTSGAMACTDRCDSGEVYIFRKYKADLRGVVDAGEFMCYYAQPSSAVIPGAYESKYTCAGASNSMTSSALEFDFSRIHTNL